MRAASLVLFAIACVGSTVTRAEPLGCLIQPYQEADIGSQVVGVIEQVLVERGDFVKKGQPVAQLNSDVQRAALQSARLRAEATADLRAAASNHEFAQKKKVRTEDLYQKNFISQQATIDPLKVEVIVPASYFSRIKQGMSATVKPDGADAESRTAKVIVVDKVIDAASNSFRVRLELPNPNLSLPPGLRCKVEFDTGAPAADNALPKPAVRPSAESSPQKPVARPYVAAVVR